MRFDVEKDTAKVRFILEKKQVHQIVAEVIATLDLSGSTRDLYYSGTMQEAIQRVVPVAINFDDNGELPVYGFNDKDDISVLPALTAGNYAGYVLREIINKSSVKKWGGTDYAPVLRQVLRDLEFMKSRPTGRKTGGFLGMGGTAEMTESLGKTSKTGLPAIVYHFTDGENNDQDDTVRLLQACADLGAPIYFNCVGVGHATFAFLKKIADDLPNVEFTQITDLAATASTDEIYDHLLPDELLTWLKAYIK